LGGERESIMLRAIGCVVILVVVVGLLLVFGLLDAIF
jgi:hypothetical protein